MKNRTIFNSFNLDDLKNEGIYQPFQISFIDDVLIINKDNQKKEERYNLCDFINAIYQTDPEKEWERQIELWKNDVDGCEDIALSNEDKFINQRLHFINITNLMLEHPEYWNITTFNNLISSGLFPDYNSALIEPGDPYIHEESEWVRRLLSELNNNANLMIYRTSKERYISLLNYYSQNMPVDYEFYYFNTLFAAIASIEYLIKTNKTLKQCDLCGSLFIPTHKKNQKYCSKICVNKAQLELKKNSHQKQSNTKYI